MELKKNIYFWWKTDMQPWCMWVWIIWKRQLGKDKDSNKAKIDFLIHKKLTNKLKKLRSSTLPYADWSISKFQAEEQKLSKQIYCNLRFIAETVSIYNLNISNTI